MSHHLLLFDKVGEPVGHARVTNEGVVLSVWINARGFSGLFVPDPDQQCLEFLECVRLEEPDQDEMDGIDEGS